jgi:hypothetical protein
MILPRTKITCPYCDTTQQINLTYDRDVTGEDWQIHTCCIEEGGCDQKFVIKVGVYSTIDIAEIK